MSDACPDCGHMDKARQNVVDRLVARLWRHRPACPSRDVDTATGWGGDVCGCLSPWHVAGT